MLMSCEGEVCDLSAILNDTNLLQIIAGILQHPDNTSTQLIRHIKLEATWIMTNITFGDAEHIKMMLSDEYEFISHFNLILKGNDLQMID